MCGSFDYLAFEYEGNQKDLTNNVLAYTDWQERGIQQAIVENFQNSKPVNNYQKPPQKIKTKTIQNTNG